MTRKRKRKMALIPNWININGRKILKYSNNHLRFTFLFLIIGPSFLFACFPYKITTSPSVVSNQYYIKIDINANGVEHHRVILKSFILEAESIEKVSFPFIYKEIESERIENPTGSIFVNRGEYKINLFNIKMEGDLVIGEIEASHPIDLHPGNLLEKVVEYDLIRTKELDDSIIREVTIPPLKESKKDEQLSVVFSISLPSTYSRLSLKGNPEKETRAYYFEGDIQDDKKVHTFLIYPLNPMKENKIYSEFKNNKECKPISNEIKSVQCIDTRKYGIAEYTINATMICNDQNDRLPDLFIFLLGREVEYIGGRIDNKGELIKDINDRGPGGELYPRFVLRDRGMICSPGETINVSLAGRCYENVLNLFGSNPSRIFSSLLVPKDLIPIDYEIKLPSNFEIRKTYPDAITELENPVKWKKRNTQGFYPYYFGLDVKENFFVLSYFRSNPAIALLILIIITLCFTHFMPKKWLSFLLKRKRISIIPFLSFIFYIYIVSIHDFNPCELRHLPNFGERFWENIIWFFGFFTPMYGFLENVKQKA